MTNINEILDRLEAAEKQEPVAAQHRFRHPHKNMPTWTDWWPCEVSNRPAWEVDSQGYEVEYRALCPAPGTQPAQRMNMQTADQITQAFKAELQALLDKYGAELSARDTWEGYPECGEDVRMQVDIPAIYDADHNCLREYTEIDLGSWVPSTQAMPKEAKP